LFPLICLQESPGIDLFTEIPSLERFTKNLEKGLECASLNNPVRGGMTLLKTRDSSLGIGISNRRMRSRREIQKIETLQVSKRREDLDRPLRIHVAEIEVYYRESGYRHSRGQGSGKSIVKTPAKSEPSVWGDRCQKSEESRDIRHREIGVPEVERIGTSQVSKSQEKSGPSIRGGRVAAIGAIGESPDRKLLIGVWVIGISGILVTKCLCILESRSLETPMSGSQLSAQQTRKEAPLCGPAVNMAENRDLRDRQSRRQMFFDI
jgi:hypothetical protein